jgi:hypothetical protein
MERVSAPYYRQNESVILLPSEKEVFRNGSRCHEKGVLG